jgi:hypothetical protein
MLSALVYLACPVVAIYGLSTPDSYDVSDYFLNAVAPFDVVGATITKLFGLEESREGWLAFMRLMAFAYTYHFLNWFSKTRVINWHRTSKMRLSFIAVAYAVSVVIYAVDFRVGYTVLLMLSLLHVVLELPLNFRSALGVFQEIVRWRRAV